MPEDIITYVCSDLSTNAPKAEAGLRDQACDRILGRYIQEEALERVRDDPEDLLACLRECITLDNEQLAKAKEALGKLAPPAAALTLGGNANTLPKREWAEVKKLGTNRETALALFGLDLRDRVGEVARRFVASRSYIYIVYIPCAKFRPTLPKHCWGPERAQGTGAGNARVKNS